MWCSESNAITVTPTLKELHHDCGKRWLLIHLRPHVCDEVGGQPAQGTRTERCFMPVAPHMPYDKSGPAGRRPVPCMSGCTPIVRQPLAKLVACIMCAVCQHRQGYEAIGAMHHIHANGYHRPAECVIAAAVPRMNGQTVNSVERCESCEAASSSAPSRESTSRPS